MPKKSTKCMSKIIKSFVVNGMMNHSPAREIYLMNENLHRKSLSKYWLCARFSVGEGIGIPLMAQSLQIKNLRDTGLLPDVQIINQAAAIG